jgi:hypothetical protein
MADGSKAGLAGGVLVVLGLGFARVGDDCARAGIRGAGALDEVGGAASGTRMASWGPNEIAGARTGLGADDATRMGARADGAAMPGLHGAGAREGVAGARGGEGPWFEAVRDFGVDVGVEIASTDLDGDLPAAVATPGEVRCPRRLEITRSPGEWDELLGGFGVGCAPVILVGTASADGKALRMGEEDVPLLELVRSCADVGARCLVVGCPAEGADACVAETKESHLHTRLQPSLPIYVREFVERALTQEVAPVVIAQLAAVDGRAKLVIARPRAGSKR